MKTKEIKLNALINIGPYSHVTMDVLVELEDGENCFTALSNFKLHAEAILGNKAVVTLSKPETVSSTVPVEVVKEEVVVAPVKATRKKAAKPTPEVAPVKEEEFTTAIPEVIKEAPVKEAKKAKLVMYDSNSPEHKSILGTYLGTTYPNWKTFQPKEVIMAFTSTLKGTEYLENDGTITQSFLNSLESFFGA